MAVDSNSNPEQPKKTSAAWEIIGLTAIFVQTALMLPSLTPYLAAGTFLTSMALMRRASADPNYGRNANGQLTYDQFKADKKAGKGPKPLNFKQVFLAAALGCAPGLVGYISAEGNAEAQAALATEKALPTLNMNQQIPASTVCQLASGEQDITVGDKNFRLNCPVTRDGFVPFL